jgi:putative flippase GtrA
MYHHRPHLSHRKRGIVEYAVMGLLTYLLYKVLFWILDQLFHH